MKIRVYNYAITTVLGKGKRFILWVQGCYKRCFNCMAADSWDINKGELIDIKDIAQKINSAKIDGITISGGEPFLQAKELSYLLDLVDKDLDVMVYTGYSFNELSKKEHKELLSKIDLLIDGEYIDELNEDTPLIGSSNQKVYVFSQKGKRLLEHMKALKKREIEVIVKDKEVFVIGVIPKKLKGKI